MALYNPQSFPTGCPVITINSVTYKANSFARNSPTQKENIYDEVGAPLGVHIQADFEEITAELQLATEATAVPTTAAASATTGVFTYDTATWAITQVSAPRTKLGGRVVNITAQKNAS